MAVINEHGNVIARCPGCDGGKSTFEWRSDKAPLSAVVKLFKGGYRPGRSDDTIVRYQLLRCAGCGRGALGVIRMMGYDYPDKVWELLDFYPESMERLKLPADVPAGIQNEFREAEMCLEHQCYRAAAALFRSVLDKTMRANGYKTKENRNLEIQIDEAAKDGVITPARQLRAHEEIRVLGNDILHDEWHAVTLEDVGAAHHYAQRILEDFYDDRKSVLGQLRAAKRVPDEHKPSAPKN